MKKLMCLFLSMTLLLGMAACNNEKPVESVEPVIPGLSGQWKQVNSESEDSYQGAIIEGDKIEIYWVSNNGDTRSLYWAGSFTAPETAEEPYNWVSQNNKDKTSGSIMASPDDTKAFTYINNQITYSASAMGTTTTVRLEKEEWCPGLEIEVDVQPSDDIPEVNGYDGFDETTAIPLTMAGIELLIPDYYEQGEEEQYTDGIAITYTIGEENSGLAMLHIGEIEISENEEEVYVEFEEMFKRKEDVELNEFEKTSIAGLTGRMYAYDQNSGGIEMSIRFAAVCNSKENKGLAIMLLTIKGQDEQFVTDYNKIIETAKLTTQPELGNASGPVSGLRPEFKQAMDSYEAFFDEYVAFMKSFSSSDNTLAMLADYTKFMSQYVETMEALEGIDQNELSPEELSYYTEVMTRINQKLLTVTS